MIECNCALIAPTMPTCRSTHLATCPVYSALIEAEHAEVRRMLKENDTEGLAAYVNRDNRRLAQEAAAKLSPLAAASHD